MGFEAINLKLDFPSDAKATGHMASGIPFPDLSPELFSLSLFGMEFALRWYALAYIVGIMLGWAMARHILARPALWPNEHPPLNKVQLEDLLTWIVLGVIIGGRLGIVLFYHPAYYAQNPIEIFMIWKGGMAFHGGLLGVIAASWIWSARQGVPRLQLADLLALATPAGLLLGRLANFINAELWGRPSDLPWAVIFPGESAQDCGQALGMLCARHPSQLYEAALEGLLLGLILLLLLARGALKRPGLIAGSFFTGYGAARFFVEFFRQPDAHFVSQGNPLGLALHVDGYGLTQGQLLSLPMIAIGILLILRARA